MSKIWFTSDTHFGSKRTLELSKRPFQSVEEMDDIIITNWNSVVSENDIVYHLGDFGDYNRVQELNGYIKLLPGNYEVADTNFDGFKYLFDDILTDVTKLTLKTSNTNQSIHLSHEPSKIKLFEMTENNINLFGHIHKLSMVKRYGLNVGTDCHNFTPIDLKTVEFYHNAILNFYDNEVF